MKAYRIPLTAQPQRFSVTLGGAEYTLTLSYYTPIGWVVDIAQNEEALINGLPLVTGTDLLAPYGYLGIGGALVVQTDADAYAPPTRDNLGSQSNLYFLA